MIQTLVCHANGLIGSSHATAHILRVFKLDAPIKFVGPGIAARGDAGDFPLAHLEGQQVIYISFGTLLNEQIAFYRASIQAFADSYPRAADLVLEMLQQHEHIV